MTYDREHPNDIGYIGALPPADPRVTSALRGAVGEPAYDAVNWETLRAKILARAAATLERRRERGETWLAYLSRWSRAGVPIGLAAAAAAMMLAGSASQTSTSNLELTPEAALMAAVTGQNSRAALADSVAGQLSGLREYLLLGEGVR